MDNGKESSQALKKSFGQNCPPVDEMASKEELTNTGLECNGKKEGGSNSVVVVVDITRVDEKGIAFINNNSPSKRIEEGNRVATACQGPTAKELYGIGSLLTSGDEEEGLDSINDDDKNGQDEKKNWMPSPRVRPPSQTSIQLGVTIRDQTDGSVNNNDDKKQPVVNHASTKNNTTDQSRNDIAKSTGNAMPPCRVPRSTGSKRSDQEWNAAAANGQARAADSGTIGHDAASKQDDDDDLGVLLGAAADVVAAASSSDSAPVAAKDGAMIATTTTNDGAIVAATAVNDGSLINETLATGNASASPQESAAQEGTKQQNTSKGDNGNGSGQDAVNQSTAWQQEWEECFKLAAAYKEEHGNITTKQLRSDKSLNAKKIRQWLYTQRSLLSGNSLSSSQLVLQGRLRAIGVRFRQSLGAMHTRSWDEWVKLYLEYKEQHGTYVSGKTVFKGKTLGKWCANQRYFYALQQRGIFDSHSKALTAQRLDQLNKIGFVWSKPGSKQEAHVTNAATSSPTCDNNQTKSSLPKKMNPAACREVALPNLDLAIHHGDCNGKELSLPPAWHQGPGNLAPEKPQECEQRKRTPPENGVASNKKQKCNNSAVIGSRDDQMISPLMLVPDHNDFIQKSSNSQHKGSAANESGEKQVMVDQPMLSERNMATEEAQTSLTNEELLHKLRDLEEQLKTSQSEKQRLSQRVQLLEHEKKSGESAQHALEEEKAEMLLTNGLVSNLELQLNDSRKEVEKQLKCNKDLTQKVQNLEGQLKVTQDGKSQAEQTSQDLGGLVQQYKFQVESLKVDMNNLSCQAQELSFEKAQWTRAKEELSGQVSNLASKLRDSQNEQEQMSRSNQNLIQQLEDLKAQTKSYETKVSACNKTKQKEHMDEINRLQSANKEISHRLQICELELQSTLTELGKEQTQLQGLRDSLQKALSAQDDQLKTLQEACANEKLELVNQDETIRVLQTELQEAKDALAAKDTDRSGLLAALSASKQKLQAELSELKACYESAFEQVYKICGPQATFLFGHDD